MHPDLTAALSRLDPAFAAHMIAASDAITSPAQLYLVAHHLLNGKPIWAMFVAKAPAGLYEREDAVLGLAWAIGKRHGQNW